MILDRVPAGKGISRNDFNVIIEIPRRRSIKYELDKDTGAMFVDRSWAPPCSTRPTTAVPQTPVGRWRSGGRAGGHRSRFRQVGVVVRCRALGVLKMEDDRASTPSWWPCRWKNSAADAP